MQLLAAYAAQPIEERPLALRLLEAIEAAPRERRTQLREIGDTSLFISGFWADSLADKLVDVDYYIDLGGTAYGELARGGTGWTGDPFGDGLRRAGGELHALRRGADDDQPPHAHVAAATRTWFGCTSGGSARRAAGRRVAWPAGRWA